MLSLCHGAKKMQVRSRRGSRVLLLVASLLEQIELIDHGKLTVSWGDDSPLKYSIESHGREEPPHAT